MSEAPRARNSGVDPVRELHNGQRRVKSRINRPDTRKHLDYAALPSKNLLAFEGASTHGHWSHCGNETFEASVDILQCTDSRLVDVTKSLSR